MSTSTRLTTGQQAQAPGMPLGAFVRLLEHEVLVGVDHATDFLLAPFAIDFRGWTFGDQRNETWM